MASFGETFERLEKKYRISAGQRQRLLCMLEPYMALDCYGKHTVTSIYLDDPDASLICRSMEKPLYKEKLRIRYYGDPTDLNESSEVFVEVKKKFKGVVYKRRVRVTYAAAWAFLSGAPYQQACEAWPLSDQLKASESLSMRSIQIAREIRQFVDFHGPLQASMIIACDRKAFLRRSTFLNGPLSLSDFEESSALLDDNLRITFDEGIRYRSLTGFAQSEGCSLVPEASSVCKAAGTIASPDSFLLLPGESIMEIKAVGAMPLWLVRALSSCDIKPISFSKYGEAFKASFREPDSNSHERLSFVSVADDFWPSVFKAS